MGVPTCGASACAVAVAGCPDALIGSPSSCARADGAASSAIAIAMPRACVRPGKRLCEPRRTVIPRGSRGDAGDLAPRLPGEPRLPGANLGPTRAPATTRTDVALVTCADAGGARHSLTTCLTPDEP